MELGSFIKYIYCCYYVCYSWGTGDSKAAANKTHVRQRIIARDRSERSPWARLVASQWPEAAGVAQEEGAVLSTPSAPALLLPAFGGSAFFFFLFFQTTCFPYPGQDF